MSGKISSVPCVVRSSMFEATFELSPKEATALIERAYFRLSKFGRMCPVEVYKGNASINLWNAPGIAKIPILHRSYIYYIGRLCRQTAQRYVGICM
jgi:hypothetical protein